jgi:glucose-6-phosphate isomerase
MPGSSIHAAALRAGLDAAHARLSNVEFAAGLWAGRADLWSTEPATRAKIAQRLGWLSARLFVEQRITAISSFADRVRADRFTHVVLLGMGGSSLAPEVMRQVFGSASGFPELRMLDSVNPDAVRAAMSAAATSLFVVASKSGSTLEPNTMAAEARRRVEAAGHHDWGSRFVAITDPDSPLHEQARANHYREIFLNPPDIGGRYSALSLFGLVPAALMGIPLQPLLRHAEAMETACRNVDSRTNPGLALGALLGAAVLAGRDKLTVLLPPHLASVGLWIEQLIAESTGKHGKGIVPIVGEPASQACGADRVVVVVQFGEEPLDQMVIARLDETQTPVAMVTVSEDAALGGEFLRWEIATATAGFLMGINPFDEPNVQEAKDATRALLSAYASSRTLPGPTVHARLPEATLSLSAPAKDRLGAAPPTDILRIVARGDYFAVLAYVPPSDETWQSLIQRFRLDVGARLGVATSSGFGPRYLHSTGQLHKGGAANGVFVILTCRCAQDLPIPGKPYSFGILEAAQALGDFSSLERAGRRVVLVQADALDPALVDRVFQTFLHAL